MNKEWYHINWDIRDSMSVLGWDKKTWTDEMQPDLYSKKWEDLSKDEQSAAYKTCYFSINWPGGTDASVEDVATFIEQVQVVQQSTVIPSNSATDGIPRTSESSKTVAGTSELIGSPASSTRAAVWTKFITVLSLLFISAQFAI